MTIMRDLFGVIACATLLLACGSRVSPEEVGETLLTLEGTAELEGAPVEVPLHPALAFRIRTPRGHQLHFLRAETEGEFPMDFSLRITKPPSRKVLDASRELYEIAPDSRPPFPVAYLAAVTDDLPNVIYAEPSQSGQTNCVSGPPCAEEWMWCVNSAIEGFDDEDCYGEQRTCEAGAFSSDDCTTTSSKGNPDVFGAPWTRLSGLAPTLRIFYLSEALAADDPVAIQLELPALEAGYHALEVIGPTDEELEDAEACHRTLMEEGIADYNAEHETEYTYDEIAQCWSDLYHVDSCTNDGDRALVFREAHERIFLEGQPRDDLPCSPVVEPRRRVLTSEELHEVSMQIGSNVAPSTKAWDEW